jgi:hypothetical protein
LFWYSRQAITLVIQAVALRWKYHIAFLNYLRKRSEIKKSKKRLLDSCMAPIPLEIIAERIIEDIGKAGVVVKINT